MVSSCHSAVEARGARSRFDPFKLRHRTSSVSHRIPGPLCVHAARARPRIRYYSDATARARSTERRALIEHEIYNIDGTRRAAAFLIDAAALFSSSSFCRYSKGGGFVFTVIKWA